MENKIIQLLIFILIFVFALHVSVNAQTPSINDITSQLEDLGIPSTKHAYAKNVWDLQAWNGKIYIGSGNSSNIAPDTNAGPIPVMYFDPITKTVTNEFTVDEEQIDRFPVLNNLLAIPGHDARDPSGTSNWYLQAPTGWVKYRNLIGGEHTFELIDYNGLRFAALGTSGAGAISISTDSGQTWKNLYVPKGGVTQPQAVAAVQKPCIQGQTPSMFIYTYRAYELFLVNGNLYANFESDGGTIYCGAGNKWTSDFSLYPTIGVWDGKDFIATPINFFGPFTTADRIVRPAYFGNKTVYIAATTTNDEQWAPNGLLFVDANSVVSPATLPTNATPWDIVVRGNTLYVLGDIKTDATHHIVTVDKTSDLTNWTEILRFNADTFARSFEELNGYFYFGLGSDTTTIPADTGKLFRVQYTATPSPTLTRKPGDTNGDNKVDGLDYVVWLNNYGKIVSGVSNGDFNSDNKVDGLDYVIWLNGYAK